MADQRKGLTDLEREAAYSWREWPIYIVLRLKHLQAIQQRLRVQGETQSARLRRDELLKAVYDIDDDDEAATPAPPAPASAEADGEAEFSVNIDEYADDNYADDIEYEDA
jgi:hypothetical protein